ncbi:MAG: cupredoxin domain-containing protein [Rickettsiales endosymbiont of Dermacentor nuttalli]
MHELYKLFLIVLFITFATLTISSLHIETKEEFVINLQNRIFTPSHITIPPNTKVKLIINNLDDSVEEFESTDLKKERLIPANSMISTTIGPLAPGIYNFVGEFHKDTAHGKIEVK